MSNFTPPIPVVRADPRPIRVVPLRQTLAWDRFVVFFSGGVGFLAGGWAVYGLVIISG